MENNINAITYTQRDLPKNAFYLDQILNRLPPLFQIDRVLQPSNTIGRLSELPSETLCEILESLPISDLIRFRKCSRSANYFADTMPRFGQIFTHAPNTVKTIVATRATANITLPILYKKLNQRECDGRGSLASFIYVGTCLRYCLDCCYSKTYGAFNILTTSDCLNRHEGATRDEIQTIPSFRFLPVTFKNGLHRIRVEGVVMYDAYTAKQNLKHHKHIFKHGRHQKELRKLESPEYAAIPGVTIEREEPPASVRRHMSIVSAPWLDFLSSSAQEGLYCSACFYTKHQDQLHTVHGLQEHLKDCRISPVNPLSRFMRDCVLGSGFELGEDDTNAVSSQR